MQIFLISLATITGITIGLLFYRMVDNELGANLGFLLGIAFITVSVYFINASRQ